MTTPAEATPRPWFAQSFDLHHLLHGPDQGGVDVGGLLGELTATHADAALIIAAVNDYDRLLRVEAAARRFLDVYDQTHLVHDVGYESVNDAAAVLRRAALDPTAAGEGR